MAFEDDLVENASNGYSQLQNGKSKEHFSWLVWKSGPTDLQENVVSGGIKVCKADVCQIIINTVQNRWHQVVECQNSIGKNLVKEISQRVTLKKVKTTGEEKLIDLNKQHHADGVVIVGFGAVARVGTG